MNADAGFIIGSTHFQCQDYARVFQTGEEAGAALCDGCSSSVDVDIGARQACLAALSDPTDDPGKIERVAASLVHSYSVLHPGWLDTTLLLAKCTSNGGTLSAKLWVCGDGVVVLDYEDRREILQFTYPGNAPLYLSYLCDAGRRNAHTNAFGGVGKLLRQTGGISEESAICGVWHQEYAGLKSVTLLSDGIGSFSRNDAGLGLEEILAECLGFKSTNGVFMQRRLNRLRRDWLKNQTIHEDDLSMTVITV